MPNANVVQRELTVDIQALQMFVFFRLAADLHISMLLGAGDSVLVSAHTSAGKNRCGAILLCNGSPVRRASLCECWVFRKWIMELAWQP